MEEFEILDHGLTEGEAEITPTIKKLSAEIAPWIKTIAIINLVMQALTLIQTFRIGNSDALIEALITAGITVALSIVLLNWGTAMQKLGRDGSSSSFSETLVRQKSYWIFYGIIWIILILLIIIFILVAINDPTAVDRYLGF